MFSSLSLFLFRHSLKCHASVPLRRGLTCLLLVLLLHPGAMGEVVADFPFFFLCHSYKPYPERTFPFRLFSLLVLLNLRKGNSFTYSPI